MLPWVGRNLRRSAQTPVANSRRCANRSENRVRRFPRHAGSDVFL